MGIRRPSMSVTEARRLSNGTQSVVQTEQDVLNSDQLTVQKGEVVQLRSEPSQGDFISPSRIQVFVSASLPSVGVSVVFDTLCAQYPAAKSLQMILRRSLDEYEPMLADGSFLAGPKTYVLAESGATLVQTSRMMMPETLAKARAHFDPLGLESARVFGRRLATAALATFFRNELGRYR